MHDLIMPASQQPRSTTSLFLFFLFSQGADATRRRYAGSWAHVPSPQHSHAPWQSAVVLLARVLFFFWVGGGGVHIPTAAYEFAADLAALISGTRDGNGADFLRKSCDNNCVASQRLATSISRLLFRKSCRKATPGRIRWLVVQRREKKFLFECAQTAASPSEYRNFPAYNTGSRT